MYHDLALGWIPTLTVGLAPAQPEPILDTQTQAGDEVSKLECVSTLPFDTG